MCRKRVPDGTVLAYHVSYNARRWRSLLVLRCLTENTVGISSCIDARIVLQLRAACPLLLRPSLRHGVPFPPPRRVFFMACHRAKIRSQITMLGSCSGGGRAVWCVPPPATGCGNKAGGRGEKEGGRRNSLYKRWCGEYLG